LYLPAIAHNIAMSQAIILYLPAIAHNIAMSQAIILYLSAIAHNIAMSQAIILYYFLYNLKRKCVNFMGFHITEVLIALQLVLNFVEMAR
jgi:hypothetical protein